MSRFLRYPRCHPMENVIPAKAGDQDDRRHLDFSLVILNIFSVILNEVKNLEILRLMPQNDNSNV